MLVTSEASTKADRPAIYATDAIHTGAAQGCLGFLQFLLDEGHETDVNRRDPFGYTPLHHAFGGERQHETIQWLVSRGADIDAELSIRGATLLHVACYDGKFDDAGFLLDAGFIKKLLLSGTSLDPYPGGLSPVSMAASNHQIQILELFHKAGRDFSTEEQAIAQALQLKEGDEYLHKDLQNPLPTLNWLLVHGAPAVLTSKSISAALVDYCYLESDSHGTWPYDVLSHLLELGLDPNTSYDGSSIFWHCYNALNLPMCQLLMEYGADGDQLHDLFDDIFSFSWDWDTSPGYYDKAYNHQDHGKGNPNADGLRFLLDCDMKAPSAMPPMWLALATEKWAFARLLIDYGAPVTDLDTTAPNGTDYPHHHHEMFLWGLRNAPSLSTLSTKAFSELLDYWYLVTRDENSAFTQAVSPNILARLSPADEHFMCSVDSAIALLERGADPLQKDDEGVSAMDIIELDLAERHASQSTEVSLLDFMKLRTERNANSRVYKLTFHWVSRKGSWETRSYFKDEDSQSP
ncbi:hypothetical protein DL769_010438 [Monosporascus sp. CRB-8-3]|nr:hypothetical protein DL769_010438 [Monosporascus sp. CRB-8-3]